MRSRVGRTAFDAVWFASVGRASVRTLIAVGLEINLGRDGPVPIRDHFGRGWAWLSVVTLVLAYAEGAFEKNLPERGQFAFLAKPFTLKQLIAAVKDTMA